MNIHVKLQQSQPQDPWNEPLTPVLVFFFEEAAGGGESASSSLIHITIRRSLSQDPELERQCCSIPSPCPGSGKMMDPLFVFVIPYYCIIPLLLVPFTFTGMHKEKL